MDTLLFIFTSFTTIGYGSHPTSFFDPVRFNPPIEISRPTLWSTLRARTASWMIYGGILPRAGGPPYRSVIVTLRGRIASWCMIYSLEN